MKRRARGGGTGGGGGGIQQNKNKNKTKKPPPPPPPVIGTVATRTRHQQKTKASSWNKPIPILINIFTYADPETLRILSLVSTQFYDIICNSPAMINHCVVPLLQISPSKDQEDPGRTNRLIHQLHRHRAKLQHYREIKVIDGHKFVWKKCSPHLNRIEIKRMLIAHRFEVGLIGVVSLDLSSSTPAPPNRSIDISLLYLMAHILPNLRQINLSNFNTRLSSLRELIQNCSRLEKITWKKIPSSSGMDINGYDLEKATNLKEIYMDDAEFFPCPFMFHQSSLESHKYPRIFLFHQCGSNKLERVSIRNATYGNAVYFPQEALIKFVRKAPPSLRWFRSNLTAENITMLRLERPAIECVN